MNSAQMGAAASCALDLDVGVVVVADPHDAEQVGGVAGEPGVVAVPVLPAAGAVKPRERVAAPVPWLITFSSMSVVR
jgi:hypothetical protein